MSEEPAEKVVEGILEKITKSKLAVIVLVCLGLSLTGFILYMIFGRKKEGKKE